MFLKAGTAATVKLGPFVDDTDGKTAETGLTIAQASIRLSKAGGDFAQTNNATGATHDENGYYDVPLDTTDTNTAGRLRVAVSVAGALPVWQDFVVLPAAVYDSLVAGTDNLQVDAIQWGGTAVASAYVQANTAQWGGAALPTQFGVSDKTGFSLTAAYDAAKSAAPAGAAMTLTAGERTAVADEVERQIIDETDSEKVLTAITDKIAAVNPSLSGLTLAAIASAVRDAILNRVLAGNHDTAGTPGKLLQNADATMSSRMAAGSYVAPNNDGIATLLTDIGNVGDTVATTQTIVTDGSYGLQALLTAIQAIASGGDAATDWTAEQKVSILAAVAQITEILTDTSAFTSSTVLRNPVSTTGEITIYRGDDNDLDYANQIDLTDPGDWPAVPEGAKIRLRIKVGSTSIDVDGSEVAASNPRVWRWEIPHATTATLRIGTGAFAFGIATTGTPATFATLGEGTAYVRWGVGS